MSGFTQSCVPSHLGEHLPYEFYDTKVSTSVKNVYQCASIHDCLLFFQPCTIGRKATLPEGYNTEECWVPGCHYDVGHQHFHFGIGSLTWVAHGLKTLNPNLVPPEILPNHAYADVALNWIIGKMVENGFPDPRGQDLVTPPLNNPNVSSKRWEGDVYGKLLEDHGLSEFKSCIIGDRILPPNYQRVEFVPFWAATDNLFSMDYKSMSLVDYSSLYPNANEPTIVQVDTFQIPERILGRGR